MMEEIFSNDPYLFETIVAERLLKEYKKYSSLIVAVDFDGTLYDFHNEGFKFPKIIQLLKEAKEMNCYIFIYTANPDENFVKKYLEENEIPFDTINDSPVKENMNSNKPYYNILLDDRAGLTSAYRALNYVLEIIKEEQKIK